MRRRYTAEQRTELLDYVTVDGKPHGVSRHLIRASDGLDFFDGAAVDAAVMKIDRQPPSVVVTDPVSVPKPAPRPGPSCPPNPQGWAP